RGGGRPPAPPPRPQGGRGRPAPRPPGGGGPRARRPAGRGGRGRSGGPSPCSCRSRPPTPAGSGRCRRTPPAAPRARPSAPGGPARRPARTFFSRQAPPPPRAGDPPGAAGRPRGPPPPLPGGRAQRRRGGVGAVRARLAEPLGAVPGEGGGLAAAVGPRRDRAGLPPPRQELVHPGDADAEPLGDLFPGAFAAVAGGDDPLP